MKVCPVQQDINFESKHKPRYINDSIRWNIESLLLRMNGSIKTEPAGAYNKITYIKKLILNENNASFEDKRNLTKKVPFKEQMQGSTVIRVGKKIYLNINNETGEIVDYSKPFYRTWYGVYRKIKNVLVDMRGLFGLDEEVKKITETVKEPVSACTK